MGSHTWSHGISGGPHRVEIRAPSDHRPRSGEGQTKSTLPDKSLQEPFLGFSPMGFLATSWHPPALTSQWHHPPARAPHASSGQAAIGQWQENSRSDLAVWTAWLGWTLQCWDSPSLSPGRGMGQDQVGSAAGVRRLLPAQALEYSILQT